MTEDPKAGELETREHMGRADEPPPSESPTPEGLLGPRALKEYVQAAGLPELESIARTPDQLGAVQLAQQIRIAEALERSATALERIGLALWALVPPAPEPPDALSGDAPAGTDVAPPRPPPDLPRVPGVAPPPDDRQSDGP